MTAHLLTLGPVLFNWAPDSWRDFYFRIADEAPVDVVFLGEVVCSKRAPLFADRTAAVVERLSAAGKRVVRSTPILVTSDAERAALREMAATSDPLEANDLGAVALLDGRPHAIGPYVNVYNETTLAWAAGRGAESVTLNPELPAASVGVLAAAGNRLGVAIEVQVFGRMPLAISARCYHARSHGLHKDSCRYVCAEDPDGLAVETLDAQPFLAINGTQTLSHACLNLAADLDKLKALGVTRFRLSPQTVNMVRVARAFHDLLEGRDPGVDAAALSDPIPAANGFFHDREGAAKV